VVSLAVGWWACSTGHPAWQTMVFTTLTLTQMGHVMAIRSERISLFRLLPPRPASGPGGRPRSRPGQPTVAR
jgi:magnesium-transporting ATPase (P-type)